MGCWTTTRTPVLIICHTGGTKGRIEVGHVPGQFGHSRLIGSTRSLFKAGGDTDRSWNKGDVGVAEGTSRRVSLESNQYKSAFVPQRPQWHGKK